MNYRKKLIFCKDVDENSKMSFKNELNKKVVETRDRIKNKAINNFVESLKSAMYQVAEEGRTRGSINIEYDYQEEDEHGNEYNKEIYNQLRQLLILQDEIAENSEIINTYRWLTENVKKTDIFKDIYIEIEDDCVQFHWYLNDDD